MLCLSRFKGESIVIADDIIVTVLDVRGDKVRLGVTADPSIPVHRSEVQEQIRRLRGELPPEPDPDDVRAAERIGWGWAKNGPIRRGPR